MEEMKTHTEIQDMGTATSEAFNGSNENKAIQETYGETPQFFADEIQKRLQEKDKQYTIADVGAYKGELLGNLLQQLPDYNFETIGIDINNTALAENNSAQEKVVATADSLPFADHSIDTLIARYVLQWNNPDKQQKILAEMARVSKEFALIEHAGADISDPNPWREKTDELFSGVKIPKLKRGEHYYSSRDEVEKWLQDQGITFERLRERRIDNIADIFITRYMLSEEEAEIARQILGDRNYFIQTDWILLPNKTI
jgi:ubiquinone/menaquinone biosynthesis C-methylase UbiE